MFYKIDHRLIITGGPYGGEWRGKGTFKMAIYPHVQLLASWCLKHVSVCFCVMKTWLLMCAQADVVKS